MRPERARSLFKQGITTLEHVTQQSARQLVDIFIKADGFVSHRKSNQDDLTVKYNYLFSFSHKVLSEAHTLRLKQKYDPDHTLNNYMMQQNQAIHQSNYIALSDHSSSENDSSVDEESDADDDGEGAKGKEAELCK